MIIRHVINKEQALYAIKKGEFESEIVSSDKPVAVIMTQDWCPQWKDMQSWVYELQTENEVDVYELIYNKADYFYEFKSFKESKWKNGDIPYIRFYKNGRLFRDTNYIGKEQFKYILDSIPVG